MEHQKKRGYIRFPKGISLINAECVVISWGILSCPPVSGCVYAISIAVIEECQKYFIKHSVVIPRTLFCLLSRHSCMINAAKGCLCANHVFAVVFYERKHLSCFILCMPHDVC